MKTLPKMDDVVAAAWHRALPHFLDALGDEMHRLVLDGGSVSEIQLKWILEQSGTFRYQVEPARGPYEFPKAWVVTE